MYFLLVTVGPTNVDCLEMSKIRSFRTHAGVDRALINFNLTADLRPAFNWNIKQVMYEGGG